MTGRVFLGGVGVLLASLVVLPAMHVRAAAAADFPDDPDRPAFIDMCSNCHTPGHSVEQRHTEAEWRAIVNDMREKGAPGTDDDAAAVVRYLTKYFGPTSH